MPEDFETIQFDIPDDVSSRLSIEAAEENIHLNDLLCRILKEHLDKITKSSDEETDLREATSRIVTDGVTVETLSDFAKKYISWFEYGGCNGKPLREIIQDGFDLAEERIDGPRIRQ